MVAGRACVGAACNSDARASTPGLKGAELGGRLGRRRFSLAVGLLLAGTATLASAQSE